MKLITLILFFSGCYPLLLFSQFVTPRIVCLLPDSVKESSGLESIAPNRIYTHNDSGDLPRFFLIDTLGNIIRTVYISQVTATDFEDITRDPSGNIYIGDFGNNLNSRTDLRIYKIQNPALITGDTATAEVISFNYPDQFSFPPPANEMNFDCEAFYFYKDSLYLFSKNRGVSGYSRIYRLPSVPGNYTALLIDSLYTGKWITGAALNPSATALVLLSNGQLHLYNNINGNDFSNAQGILLQMDSTQKEGITFLNDSAVYISDEYFGGGGGKLYYLSLANWMPAHDQPGPFSVAILSNPSPEGFTVSLNGSSSYTMELYDVSGKLIDKMEVSTTNQPYHYFRHQAGVIFLRVTSKEAAVSIKKIVIY